MRLPGHALDDRCRDIFERGLVKVDSRAYLIAVTVLSEHVLKMRKIRSALFDKVVGRIDTPLGGVPISVQLANSFLNGAEQQ
ncbi:hypothetical protein [Achromobacter sp. Root565]|uniref:hypothetical protein n=1 Tax=Achromobacter sp. Root565 TaxID=1736564 RepID=UPI0012E3EDCE|nr:hypothetical protein [Achromobacter sp. Root565]